MANKYYTLMVIPEKSQQVRKVVIPSYVFKGGILVMAFLGVLAAIMVLDYANVVNQISENKQLKSENRQLKQSVQVFKNKMVTLENMLDRVHTFTTKLRIITNIEEYPAPTQGPVAEPATAPAAPPAHTAPAAPTPVHTETSSATTDDLNDTDTNLSVEREFDELNRLANQQEQESQFILERLGEKRSILATTPTIIPTLGYITSDYGVRVSPLDGRRKMHEGIDIANRYGADVIAPADGLVTFAGIKPGYGKVVIIDHGNGLETAFAHNSRFYVKDGIHVHRGQRIAAVGDSGHSTGPHCHYEVRASGLPVDPCWYILNQPSACRKQN
jgi:murein DD-endopeptidase MepM/ murein hydrolase activator NlpD